MKTTVTYSIVLLLVMTETITASATADDAIGDVRSAESFAAVVLDESDLKESSGLAASNVRQNRFWSHNDSGGDTRIYAFDQTGRKTGRCQLKSIDNDDWEDMSSFAVDGVARLLIADCGDNDAKRDSILLHLLDEPDPDRSTKTKKIQVLKLTYPDGPRDCEAVAVDAKRKQILLMEKGRYPVAGVYVIALPRRDADPKGKDKVTATRIATLAMPMITAVDIDPASGDIWVVSYFQAFRFSCVQRDEPIGRQLARLPRAYELPRWKQIEAVAVDGDQSVWVTSEGSPTLMGRLPSTVHAADSGR